MDLKDRKTQFVIALLIIVGILLFRSCKGDLDLKEQIGLYEAAQDTLSQTRNELGEQVSSIALFKADKKKDFLKMKSNDSTIIALQKVVKEYKGKLKTATVLGTSTNDNGSSSTVTDYDTIYTDTGNYMSPIYKTDWEEEWSVGKIVATKDSISRNIKVKNKFELTIGEEESKRGWFKKLRKKESLVTITNKNPNTVTTELRTFTIEPHKNKISIGLGVAYGFDIIGLKPTVVIGPTVHIPLISW